ncbi:hypothetical protein CK203_005789 [Vitis vinifera]|uniref:Retrotransposon gag domain-containing protein n=1 Tax=Vitis vinifera TaxID=29760 RepID=A0A438K411_VITVI|nr:hypothetical protein CK203_005789 [Vitis vinifera]
MKRVRVSSATRKGGLSLFSVFTHRLTHENIYKHKVGSIGGDAWEPAVMKYDPSGRTRRTPPPPLPTIYSFFFLKRVCPDTPSGRLLQERLNQESILVEIVRPSIWQLHGSPGTRDLNIGVGEENNFEWRRAIERKQLASERQLQALLQETEKLREENAVLRIQASSTGPPRQQRSRGQVANSRPGPESIYPGTAGAIPETRNVRPHEPHTPMHRAPHEESSDSTHFSAKRQRDKRPQLSNSMRAKLGPQEPRRPRPPVATTWEAHPNPMVTLMVQNVLPHHDPWSPLWLNDMLSTPFYSHIIHYEPPRGFLVPKFSTYDGSNDPFDHIMHYRQLMTLDIGNDALLCKVFPTSLQGQALSWFHRLPPNSVDNFRDLLEAFVGQYLCSARHKQNISTLQNIKMQDNESLREFVKLFGQVVLQVKAYSMDAVL